MSILHAAYAEEKPPIAPPTFSPTGIHYDVLQVRARFEEPMVALGDPRVEGPPFEIDCEPGSQRWIDERTWAYEFAETAAGLFQSIGWEGESRALPSPATQRPCLDTIGGVACLFVVSSRWLFLGDALGISTGTHRS